MMGAGVEHCINCQGRPRPHLTEWLFRCPACGLQTSLLAEPRHNGETLIGWTSESERSMSPLRRANAERTLDAVATNGALASVRLLDIGCAAGWFLEAARARGMSVIGIEPDDTMAAEARARGLEVHTGYFPDDRLAPGRFDVVSLNDVFEHLPDPVGVLEAASTILAPRGALVLALPTSRGTFYAAATLARRLGIGGFFDRLWQKGYESPHLFYYHDRNLRSLVERSDFELVHREAFASLSLAGLWARVTEDASVPFVLSAMVYIGSVVAYPLLRYVLPSDSILHIYRKTT